MPAVVPRYVAGPFALALALLLAPNGAGAQTKDPGFTIEQILSPSFSYGLVSARKVDRIAWIELEKGVRNVYAAAAPDFAPVKLTDAFEDDGVDMGPLALSDDGSVVVYIRGHNANGDGWIANPSSDPLGGRREVWAASTSGARPPWRIVAAPEARLSPDGRWVLYVKEGQVYRAPVDPGITSAPALDDVPPLFRDFGVHSDPVWSPDGKKIAFVSARADQRQPFPLQGQQATHSFITIYDVDSRRITYVAPSVDFDTSPVWSADGRQLAFIRKPGLPFGHFAAPPAGMARDQIPAGFLEARFQGGYTTSIWTWDVLTGEAREAWHTAPNDQTFAGITSFQWTGDHFVFEAEPQNWAHWYSVAANNPTAAPVDLTPGDAEVEYAALSADGRTLFFTSNHSDLDRRDLWKVAVAGGRPQQLTQGNGLETSLAVLASGSQVAVVQAGPRQPVSVGVVSANGGTARIVSSRVPATFPTAKHVEPQAVVIKAADGVDAHSMLFLPPDMRPGEKHPALVFIHGGPGMQTLLGYHHHDGSRGFYQWTYAMSQYFANKGYIVLSVNYRAGTGYGRAFRMPLETRDRGNSEYRDILAAGLWLKARPDVDAERLGVWGLSYGGWLTGQALSRNSDVFKAGMIFAGVQMRSASLDPNNLAYQSSPAYNIEKWTSPVLIVHGDDDRNVEFSQTVGLVQLLRAHDVPHEVIIYPNDTHYYQIHERWMKAFKATDAFFDRWLIRKDGVRTTQGQGGGG